MYFSLNSARIFFRADKTAEEEKEEKESKENSEGKITETWKVGDIGRLHPVFFQRTAHIYIYAVNRSAFSIGFS